MQHHLVISTNHPAMADHFPGNPIVPGAVILDRVAQALKSQIGNNIEINKILRAKFLSPLKAGIPAIIEFKIKGNLAGFVCSTDSSEIAVGQLEFTKI
jgi:3-hydroxymyristoyl/3-hydroxydecanoyl-(acyl carrier protein) dehydratase